LSDPAQYRQSAAECLRAMHATSDERNKAVLLIMAKAWAKLAIQDELLVERALRAERNAVTQASR
jgi:hypothetical protein